MTFWEFRGDKEGSYGTDSCIACKKTNIMIDRASGLCTECYYGLTYKKMIAEMEMLAWESSLPDGMQV